MLAHVKIFIINGSLFLSLSVLKEDFLIHAGKKERCNMIAGRADGRTDGRADGRVDKVKRDAMLDVRTQRFLFMLLLF